MIFDGFATSPEIMVRDIVIEVSEVTDFFTVSTAFATLDTNVARIVNLLTDWILLQRYICILTVQLIAFQLRFLKLFFLVLDIIFHTSLLGSRFENALNLRLYFIVYSELVLFRELLKHLPVVFCFKLNVFFLCFGWLFYALHLKLIYF